MLIHPAYVLLCVYGVLSAILLLVFSDFGSQPGSPGSGGYTKDAFPSYIHVCQRTDPNIGECIKKSVEELRPKLKEGIPELDVPPLEPLLLDEVKLRSGPNQAKIDANITNIRVYGPSSYIIKEIKPNIAKNRFAFKAEIPMLHFEGDYDIDMNILILKYKGQGPITGNFTNYSFDCVMKGKKVEIDGVEHLKFDKMLLRLNIGHSTFHLANLFRNDPTLSRATNEVVNDNSDLFMNEIKPVLEEGLSKKFTEIANKITLKFSHKELFP